MMKLIKQNMAINKIIVKKRIGEHRIWIKRNGDDKDTKLKTSS